MQRRVDRKAQDPDLAVEVDQHVRRDHAAVLETRLVGTSEALGDLGGDPGGAPGLEGSAALQHDVEGGPLAPLVHDVAAVVALIGVEHPQQTPVVIRRRPSRRCHQPLGALVVGRDEVDGDRAVQHLVVSQPEATARTLGQQVVEAVAASKEVARMGGVRHSAPPSHPRLAMIDLILGLAAGAPGPWLPRSGT